MTSDIPQPIAIRGLGELPSEDGGPFAHVLSILNPERPEPELPRTWPPHERLTVRFHDEIEPRPGVTTPTREQVELILAFGRAATGAAQNGGLLIHCHSGISRSTAAAVMIRAQSAPGSSEMEILSHLRQLRSDAWPNSLMLEFADDLLKRGGRLVAAARVFFRERLVEDPALEEKMRRLRRSHDVDAAMAGFQ
jgi:predicted protein tyrosine phosphatase